MLHSLGFFLKTHVNIDSVHKGFLWAIYNGSVCIDTLKLIDLFLSEQWVSDRPFDSILKRLD